MKKTIWFVILALSVLISLALPNGRAAAADDVQWDGAGHIPGSNVCGDTNYPYRNPQNPRADQSVTIRERSYQFDLTAVTVWYTTNSSASAQGDWSSVSTSWQANCGSSYDVWTATIPAQTTQVWYKIALTDGTDTDWQRTSGEGSGSVSEDEGGWTTASTSLTYSPPSPVYVDDGYTSSTPGWNYDHFNSIQSAVNAVKTGGTMYLYAGTYTENVTVDRTLTIDDNQNLGTRTVDGHLQVAGAVSMGSTVMPIQVNGNITLNSGSSLTMGTGYGGDIYLRGNWINNGGTFNPNNRVVSFNGGGTQTIGGTSSTTFDNVLIVNSSGVVNLGINTTFNQKLTLNADINTGSYTLNLGPSAYSASESTGDVWGTIRRNHAFTSGNTYSFGNPDVQLTFTGGSMPTDVTVSLAAVLPFTNAADRTYSIGANGSGWTATLRLRYKELELHLVNGATENNLHILRNVSGTWTLQASTRDITANWVQTTGVTGFSDWGISGNSPTAVDLIDLNATVRPALGPVAAVAGLALAGLGLLGWQRRK